MNSWRPAARSGGSSSWGLRLPGLLRRGSTSERAPTDGWFLARAPLIVLVLGLGLTAAGFAVLTGHARAVDERRLAEEADLGVAAFSSVAQGIESVILQAAVIASATEGSPEAFESALTSRVRTSALSSVVLLRRVDDQFSTLSEVGRRQPFLSDEVNHSLRDRLAEIVAGGGLRLVELASVEEGRLVVLATRAGETEFVVYAELLLPDVLVGAPTSGTPGVLYALYFGDESASALAVTNAADLPIEGRRVTESLRLGLETPLLVFSTEKSLAGAFTLSLPWVVLGGGMILAALMALLVQASVRRQARSLALSADLKQASVRLNRSEQRYSNLFENANDLLFVTDTDGKFQAVNRAAQRIIGYTAEELIGQHFEDIVAPEHLPRARTARERKLRGDTAMTTYELELVCKDGERVELEVMSQLVHEHGRAVGVQAIARDVRERNRLEARFRSLVQNSSDAILVVAADCTIVYASPSSRRVLGVAAEDLVDQEVESIFDVRDRERITSFLSTTAPGEAERSTDARLRADNGAPRDVEIIGNNRLDDSTIEGLVLTVRDVTERKALEQQLRFQAFHDPLTGLANRRRFTEVVEQALSRPSSRSGAVLFIDINDFKTINDSLGHEHGDHVLIAIAERLCAAARPADTCARLGGDEFGVLIEGSGVATDAALIAQRMRDAIGKPIALDTRDVTVDVSIGIAYFDDHANTTEPLLACADSAMYAAKADGRRGVRVYEPEMHRTALARLELKTEFERGLARGELVTHYQPIVDLQSGETVAVEALVRWQHPERGLLAPKDFINVAEETGLIIPLGHAVVADAGQLYRQLRVEELVGPSFSISINASARELDEPTFVADFIRRIKDAGLGASDIILEITESALVNDPGAATAALEELRAAGMRLAIDDFGTGYSSLSVLQRLPVDILKVAKPFIDDLPAQRQSFADAIVRLGATLGLETVAEGIEKCDQLEQLRELNCTYGQGFYLSRPLGTMQLVEHLRAERAVRGRTDLGNDRRGLHAKEALEPPASGHA